ncbi:DNA polymerase III, epsilon subunit [Candidatus Photodesmus katoptron Akat1]|uniref:DNA polymerase III subunit epsilon n=1 Tax=Candidatus Photodesmus katoptron Akat1 TaxID=1236703 RepID=S3EGL3_9GAMM|nr:DNA polymerase III, epsilon subunit [Candidatus Photodesmus katoptron Akat1]
MSTRNNNSICKKRLIALDTETTGINKDSRAHYHGHRIIEIGAVEIINRKRTGNNFHVYIKPDCNIHPDAIKIHGITNEFLMNKPKYHDIHQEFLAFIKDTELIAHNAPFDIGFINQEFSMLNKKIGKITDYCKITDTLAIAKKTPNIPAKKNLDSLAKHYNINISSRVLHGALLDAEILADVYLAMTGGQTSLNFKFSDSKKNN